MMLALTAAAQSPTILSMSEYTDATYGDRIAAIYDASIPHTDFWQLTHDGGARHSGHFFGLEVQGDFTAIVAVQGAYVDLYHQAGVLVCADQTLWLKAGVEVFAAIPRLCCVVTRGPSDWSLGQRVEAETVWVRVQRLGAEVLVSFSETGAKYVLARQCTLTDGAAQVGFQCCAPGDTGFVATIVQFSLEQS